jgi:hypothetical protein
MEWIVFNLSPKVRRETWEGRQYLVAPLTLIVPGVLNGSRGPLYYPLEEVAKDPGIWNGVPLTVGHPRDTLTNEHVSGRSPPVIERLGIGYVFNDRLDEKGHRVAEGWFDIAKTRTVDKRILNALEAGKPIELSTGLYTDNEPAPAGATANGRPYAFTARNYRSDHVAILPDESGACSVNDGCGVLVNGVIDNANPEGCNQYKDCGGDSESGTAKLSVGDAVTYTGVAGGPTPAEFRGYHSHPDTGEKMARIIVRPAGEGPFETSAKLSQVAKGGEPTKPEGEKTTVTPAAADDIWGQIEKAKQAPEYESKQLASHYEARGTAQLRMARSASDRKAAEKLLEASRHHKLAAAAHESGNTGAAEKHSRNADRALEGKKPLRVTGNSEDTSVSNLSFLQRFLGWFTGNTEEVAVVNSNPEGINQYTSGHGLSASKDALKRTSKAAPSLEKRANDVVATAGAAHDAGEEGNHELAAQLHQQASDEHDKLADSHERSGQRFKPALHDAASESHVRAALIHSALAQKHKNLIGNAVPNQPRSKVTGRLKKLNAGTGIGDAHESAQRGALQLTDRDRELGKAAAAEKAATGNNPASWVADEDIWEKAKAAADKGDYEKDSDTYWAVVAHIYQQMGGTSKSENTANANPEGCNQYKACGAGTSVRVKPDATLKRGGEEVPHPRAGHEGVVVSHDKPSGTSVVRLTKGEDSGKQIKVKTSHIEPHAGESPEGYKREVSQKDSELQVAKKFRDLKESGDRASAEKFLTDVEEVKGTSYLHGIASDHGISLAKNPGGKGLDIATPTEIRKRILDKVFTSNTSEGGTSPTTNEGDIMPMTKEERQKAVAHLTANCSCKESKAKEEVALNQLSDEFLKSLLGNVQAGTAAAKGFQHKGKVFVFNGERGKFVVNAMKGDAEDEAECNPDSPDYDEEECRAMNKKTKNATKAKNRGDMSNDPSTRKGSLCPNGG